MFTRSRVLLASSLFLALSLFATPSLARPHHHQAGHHGHSSHSRHHVASRHAHQRHSHVASRRHARGRRNHYASHYRGHHAHVRYGRRLVRQQEASSGGLFGAPSASGFGSSVVAEARRWLGTNPTHRRSLWCGTFMNFVLKRTGHQGTGSDMARSFAHYGHRVSRPQVGAIAVMSRRGGGHVGVVSGIDPQGNPIIISGNHGHRVAESKYQGARIYAYVMP
jgi:uncharacterized protein (TIGR02594 family)